MSEFELTVEELTSEDVKRKGEEVGLDLIGVAEADVLEENPPPGSNRMKPSDILHGAASVVVVARHRSLGGASVDWDNRNKHHSDQIGLSELELNTLDLVYFIEEHGYPCMMVPAETARSKQYDQMNDGPLSLPHAAVEAGLGTLGLNLQLLTPEFGPRVILGAILTTAELEPDERMEEALCEGAKCGRCLLSCPGDAIDHFDMRVEDCRPFAEPWGFEKFLDHAKNVMEAETKEEQLNELRSSESLMIWQSMLHGDGVNTGCTRCEDVCPVGEDYEQLADANEDLPEETEEKRERLAELRRAEIEGSLPAEFEQHRRWIGDLDLMYDHVEDVLTYEYQWDGIGG